MENIYTISAYVKGPSGPVCLSSIPTPSPRTPPSPGHTSLSTAKHLSTVYISSSTQAAPPSQPRASLLQLLLLVVGAPGAHLLVPTDGGEQGRAGSHCPDGE